MAINYRGRRLSAREQKKKVMQWRGWDSKTYQREYDRLRNRVRNYERATGMERGSINAADLLARESRRQFYSARGADSAPTNLYQAIQATTSASTGAPMSQGTISKINEQAIAAYERQYHGLIERSRFGGEAKVYIERARRGDILAGDLGVQLQTLGALSSNLRLVTEAQYHDDKARGLEWFERIQVES